MKLRGRCFPLEYYQGEILTDVEIRRRRKVIIFPAVIIFSAAANHLQVTEIHSETDAFQHRTEIHKVVGELRGGVNLTEASWFLFTIWIINQQTAGFQQPVGRVQPPPNQQLLGGSSNSRSKNDLSKSNSAGTSLRMEKPSDMSQQNFMNLTKEEKRNLPDYRDGFIDAEGHPKITARFNQVKFKTPKHGRTYGLIINENGKILGTPENAMVIMDSLVKMPDREGIRWFDKGGYQKGTKRGYNSVNLYDPETGIIAVYKEQKNGDYFFATTCKVTPLEEKHLIESDGNFVTEKVLNERAALTIIINETKNDL